ncbi:hypothetical protein BH10PSE12_BH10PSE12_29830 [soil metagenome]
MSSSFRTDRFSGLAPGADRPGPQLMEFAAAFSKASGRPLKTHQEIDAAAVADFRGFWKTMLETSNLRWSGQADPVCTDDDIEHAVFFPNVRLNFAANLLSPVFLDNDVAVSAIGEDGTPRDISRADLRAHVERLAAGLAELGLKPGDRVAAVTRNGAEAVIAALAVAALGAVYSSSAPNAGADAGIDRFSQIDPVILIANLAPADHDAGIAIADRVAAIAAALPTVRTIVALDLAPDMPEFDCPVVGMEQLMGPARLPLEEWPLMPFNHPLFVMFSSGTTGRPKCILHGAGGTLIEHIKEHRLHCDLNRHDSLFFHTSCAWMMWNWQLSALASGTRIILFDGMISDPEILWAICDALDVTVLGISPSYLRMCEAAGLSPRSNHRFPMLRAILSTGSILHDDQFRWLRKQVKDIPIHSVSGGTDMLGCLVMGSPLLAVEDGKSPCRSLGIDVRALGATAQQPVGELVCANPFPSRPIGFLNDPDGSRFHKSYFAQNAGLWTHGDLLEISPCGSIRMHGRSDGVLNIRGIRIGPAEIYRIVLAQPEVQDVLAAELAPPALANAAASAPAANALGTDSELMLFVALKDSLRLSPELARDIRQRLLETGSVAHVPAAIFQVSAVPVTRSGKQSEVAATDAINGRSVRNIESIANPDILEEMRAHAAAFERQRADSIVVPGVLTDPPMLIDYLRRLWEKHLHRTPIAPNDDFFDLGGSSLVAVRMFSEIRMTTGRDLPLNTLLHAPTISRLAAALAKSGEVDGSQMIQLRPGATGHPMFMIHSMAANVVELWPFQRLLQSPRPLYAIEAHGLRGDEPCRSVAAMAADYCRLMRSVQPKGPYCLGGYSFGGLVAFEIAQQLRRSGETVDRLIMIDALIDPSHLKLRDRPAYWLSKLRGFFRQDQMPPGTKAGIFAGLSRAIAVRVHRVRKALGLTAAGQDVYVEAHLAGLATELPRVREALRMAMKSYTPEPFDGVLTYVRPAIRGNFDAIAAWQRLTGCPITVHEAPGNHFTMMSEPANVAALAHIMDDLLKPDAADADNDVVPFPSRHRVLELAR